MTLVHIAIIKPVEVNSTYIQFFWHLYRHAVIQYNIIGNLLQQSDAVIATNISIERMGAKGKTDIRDTFSKMLHIMNHGTYKIKENPTNFEPGFLS